MNARALLLHLLWLFVATEIARAYEPSDDS